MQARPVWQVGALRQQGCPRPPHGMQVDWAHRAVPMHPPPAPVAQQGCPVAPHGMQLPGFPPERPAQPSPVLQVPLPPVPQHGWLAPPHAPHIPWTQATPAPRQGVAPLQQAWPEAPHGSQVPGTPPAIRPAQPNPVEQVPFAPVPQHGWPAAPHTPQRLPPGLWMQVPAPAWHCAVPAAEQQGAPAMPQATQRPGAPGVSTAQPRPEMHPVPIPAQQGWPMIPQAPQVPVVSGVPDPGVMQPSPRAHQLMAVPWQQALPVAPHGVLQTPAEHFREELLQNPPAPVASGVPQQGWPWPPHGSPVARAQDPAVQTPVAPPVQVWPAETQIRAAVGVAPGTQQPPSLQVFAGQQAPPGVPQS